MKRREMVVVLLAAAGALYAAWSLFLAPAPGSVAIGAGLDRGKLEKAAGEARELMAKSRPSELESYVLVRAADPLPRDPFHRTTNPSDAPVVGGEGKRATFVYNGFLEMGDDRFAIINGMEYRVGEELDTAGYFLAGIDRTKVVVERRFPGQAASTRIVVPMAEADIAFVKKESDGNATAH